MPENDGEAALDDCLELHKFKHTRKGTDAAKLREGDETTRRIDPATAVIVTPGSLREYCAARLTTGGRRGQGPRPTTYPVGQRA